VTDRLPIDILTGDPAVRAAIEGGADLRALARSWRKELREFARETRTHLMYRV
jgi:uncharacterized protein YbbC (DUF1343 family)